MSKKGKTIVAAILSGLIVVEVLVLSSLIEKGLDSEPTERASSPVELPIQSRRNKQLSPHDLQTLRSEALSEQLQGAYRLTRSRADRFSEWIMEANLYTGVPEILLAGLIMAESSYRETAVSSVGAVGPAQIRMKFWADLCPMADTDPRENVICAALILQEYRFEWCSGDWVCAIRMYNVGPSGLRFNASFQSASIRYFHRVAVFSEAISGSMEPMMYRTGHWPSIVVLSQ